MITDTTKRIWHIEEEGPARPMYDGKAFTPAEFEVRLRAERPQVVARIETDPSDAGRVSWAPLLEEGGYGEAGWYRGVPV